MALARRGLFWMGLALAQATAQEGCSSLSTAAEDGSYWSSVAGCGPCVAAGCSFCLATFACVDPALDASSCAVEDLVAGDAALCPGKCRS